MKKGVGRISKSKISEIEESEMKSAEREISKITVAETIALKKKMAELESKSRSSRKKKKKISKLESKSRSSRKKKKKK